MNVFNGGEMGLIQREKIQMVLENIAMKTCGLKAMRALFAFGEYSV